MGVFKNEVGRPSNETIKKRRIIYCLIVLVVIAIIVFGIYYFNGSTKDLKGASRIDSKPSSCTLDAKEIKNKSSVAYFKCTKGHIKSLTIYASNKNGNAIKKIKTISFPSKENSVARAILFNGLKPETYYLFSVKQNDGKVINKLFYTNKKSSDDAKKTINDYPNQIKISKQTNNKLTFFWTATNDEISSFQIVKVNSKNEIISDKSISELNLHFIKKENVYGGWENSLDLKKNNYVLVANFSNSNTRVCYLTKTKKLYNDCIIDKYEYKDGKEKKTRYSFYNRNSAKTVWELYWKDPENLKLNSVTIK